MRWTATAALFAYVGWVLWADWIRPTQAPDADASGPVVTLHLHDAVDALLVEPEDHTPYRRSYFGDERLDADGNCRITREEVLARTSSVPVTERCWIHRGRWHSYYDDRTWTDSRDIQIDHLVPLAEAWDSGAYRWTAAQRQAFGNDLGSPELQPVSVQMNDEKAADDPTWWLPPKNRCRYVADWITVKARWNLSVDVRERNALDAVVATCPDQILEVRKS